jgi:hypothetical protein
MLRPLATTDNELDEDELLQCAARSLLQRNIDGYDFDDESSEEGEEEEEEEDVEMKPENDGQTPNSPQDEFLQGASRTLSPIIIDGLYDDDSDDESSSEDEEETGAAMAVNVEMRPENDGQDSSEQPARWQGHGFSIFGGLSRKEIERKIAELEARVPKPKIPKGCDPTCKLSLLHFAIA